jgi:hypothetical protein
MSQEAFNDWHIESSPTLPTSVIELLQNHSEIYNLQLFPMQAFFRTSSTDEEMQEFGEELKTAMEDAGITKYKVDANEYIATENSFQFESDDYISDVLVPENHPLLNHTDLKAILLVTETRISGYHEDESYSEQRTQRLALIDADEDAIAEYMADEYSEQDYDYRVNIKVIGYMDTHPAFLSKDMSENLKKIIIEKHPGKSLTELEHYANMYEPDQPLIISNGEFVMRNVTDYGV